MANIKVSEMTEASTFDDSDYTMIVQANQNKKISKENLLGDIEDDISTIDTNIGVLSQLTTPEKTSIVNAINSLYPVDLWENETPNTSFASQEIEISNLSNYEMIEIFAKNYGGSTHKSIISVKIPQNYDGYLCIVETDCGLINRKASIDWSNNTIEFSNATFKQPTSSSAGVTDNNRCIPLNIIGYKKII